MNPWDFSHHLRRPETAGTLHAVAAGHHLATQAGMRVLDAGGNAVDAGVAAGLVLNVVESQQCSFSGVAPIIVHLANSKQTVSIDGLGTWPAAASAEALRDQGHLCVPEGILGAVIPGAPASWLTALARFGTWTFADVAEEAIRLASHGFVMYDGMAHTVRKREREFPAGTEAHRILFPGGNPPEVGALFVQSDLGASLQHLADAEAAAPGSREDGLRAAHDAFYRGDIAAAFVGYHQAHGGLMTAADLASYSSTIENPPSLQFRGNRVFTCGPWSQGPMLLQELAILSHLDLDSYEHNSVDYLHVVLEAVKRAGQDRERHFGDPKFVDVPLQQLLSDAYSARLAHEITPATSYSYIPPDGSDAYDRMGQAPSQAYRDTTYVSVVDRWGNAFSATPSDGVMHGSPVVPGTGMAVSPRGVQSRLDPSHPSVLAPGKRPRLTPNPGLLLSDDGALMPFGTPGGDLQTQAMLQFLLNLTVFAMRPQAAIEAPRVYSYDFPDSFAPHPRYPKMVRVEQPFPTDVAAGLTERGHVLTDWPETDWPLTSVCAVHRSGDATTITAAADFRRHAYSLAR